MTNTELATDRAVIRTRANLAAFRANEQAGSIQHRPAEPVDFYTSTTARCRCQSTITLRTDGFWWHGARQGIYCREGSR